MKVLDEKIKLTLRKKPEWGNLEFRQYFGRIFHLNHQETRQLQKELHQHGQIELKNRKIIVKSTF